MKEHSRYEQHFTGGLSSLAGKPHQSSSRGSALRWVSVPSADCKGSLALTQWAYCLSFISRLSSEVCILLIQSHYLSQKEYLLTAFHYCVQQGIILIRIMIQQEISIKNKHVILLFWYILTIKLFRSPQEHRSITETYEAMVWQSFPSSQHIILTCKKSPSPALGKQMREDENLSRAEASWESSRPPKPFHFLSFPPRGLSVIWSNNPAHVHWPFPRLVARVLCLCLNPAPHYPRDLLRGNLSPAS